MDDHAEVNASIIKFKEKYPELSKYLSAKLVEIKNEDDPALKGFSLKKYYDLLVKNLKNLTLSGQ